MRRGRERAAGTEAAENSDIWRMRCPVHWATWRPLTPFVKPPLWVVGNEGPARQALARLLPARLMDGSHLCFCIPVRDRNVIFKKILFMKAVNNNMDKE